MFTTSEVAALSGISPRTLQYYDEIDLLKPIKRTSSNYRLYDENALERLQQILFFKELGFELKNIKEILDNPDYDKKEAYRKQKEALLLKRNRTDRLIDLLSRLENGEQCTSFKEFDLTEYINSLEAFKNNNSSDVVRYFGSQNNFDIFINRVKSNEPKLAKSAIKYYGSIEKYTEAMKYNLEHFSEIMEQNTTPEIQELTDKNEALYHALTSDMSKDAASDEIQQHVQDIVSFTQDKLVTAKVDKKYWEIVINSYSSDFSRAVTDTKYGAGAADYIVKALRYYWENH